MKLRALSAATIIALAPIATPAQTSAQTSAQTPAQTPAQTHTFEHEAVAAAHPFASRAGAEILAAGGNAVDAAVATSFALAVVRPQSCGIGGGGFMVIHLAGEGGEDPVQVAIDYREAAPRAVEPHFFAELPDDASTRGATAAGVPGTVAGLLFALDRYGTMDRAAVLAPAIRLATDGFEADDHYLRAASGLIPRFQADPVWQERFSFVWTHHLRRGEIREGDLIRNAPMARCLQLIADEGAQAFYQGEIAAAIIGAIERDGGPMTAEDLAVYQPRQAEPLRWSFDGTDFLGMPPPSSGGVTMAQALGILERTSYLEDRSSGPHAPQRLHLLVEALKNAFADRAEWLGGDAPPIDRLLDPGYLDQLAARIDPGATLAPASYGSREGALRAAPEDGGTSHLSVVDRRGSAVACTETINLSFGSLLAVPEFGFILNNEMDDFTTRPGEANAFGLRQSDRNLPAPGKRPLSSMSPTIALEDGQVVAVAGAAGGPRIITATLQALLNVLVFDMAASDALAAPRLHHQWSPDTLYLHEQWWGLPADPDTADPGTVHPGAVAALEGLGHTLRQRNDLGEAQLIRRAPHPHPHPESARPGEVATGPTWQAACDPASGSSPAGR